MIQPGESLISLLFAGACFGGALLTFEACTLLHLHGVLRLLLTVVTGPIAAWKAVPLIIVLSDRVFPGSLPSDPEAISQNDAIRKQVLGVYLTVSELFNDRAACPTLTSQITAPEDTCTELLELLPSVTYTYDPYAVHLRVAIRFVSEIINCMRLHSDSVCGCSWADVASHLPAIIEAIQEKRPISDPIVTAFIEANI